MLEALNHIEEYKSKALDSETDLRKSKYLAARTINAFHRTTEFEIRMMIAALLGMKSFVSSDDFYYIFPHDYISFIEENIDISDYNLVCIEENKSEENIEENIENNIKEILKLVEEDEIDKEEFGKSKGAKMYKVNKDSIVFLTQAESYIFRGEHFKEFTPLEFECIVEIKKI